MQDVLDMAAVDLARAMRERRVSPREVVDAHIARARAVNHAVNALVAERFEAARREAAEAEARLAAAGPDDDLPPLLGVPCSLKEYLGVGGMPQTGGFVHHRERTAPKDGTVVTRIRAAGAIPIGITNGPEGGMWMETHNRVYGRTKNPWDVRRTAGGSSGGEGAIVAAAGSAFGLGSDVAGSIRFPAAFCGCVGHKPSGRLVPNTGHYPDSVGEVGAILVIGPLVRRVRDVMPILRVIAGPDGEDPYTREMWLGDPAGVDLRDVTVHTFDDHALVRCDEDTCIALHAAVRALEARGARRATFRHPALAHAVEIWSAIMAASTERSFTESLPPGFSALRELGRLAFGRSDFTLPTVVLALVERGQPLLRRRLERMAALGRELQGALESALGDGGVLLHPPYTRAAPVHRRALLTPFDFVCCGLFSVMEVPATAVPLGFSGHGLPLGVQIVARRGQDHLTLAVAEALEREFGGWVRANP
jgi:fatty acid amide hydrolase 2